MSTLSLPVFFLDAAIVILLAVPTGIADKSDGLPDGLILILLTGETALTLFKRSGLEAAAEGIDDKRTAGLCDLPLGNLRKAAGSFLKLTSSSFLEPFSSDMSDTDWDLGDSFSFKGVAVFVSNTSGGRVDIIGGATRGEDSRVRGDLLIFRVSSVLNLMMKKVNNKRYNLRALK